MAAAKFLQLISGKPSVVSANDSSAGAGDAGKIVALDASGKIDSTMMPAGLAADSRSVTASENIAAGAVVNLWNDGGTLKVRNANATAAGKEVHGFCLSAITSGAAGTVTFDGAITGLSGLTIGDEYFLSTTDGTITATAPSTVGNVVQSVGIAVSASELIFEKGVDYEIVS